VKGQTSATLLEQLSCYAILEQHRLREALQKAKEAAESGKLRKVRVPGPDEATRSALPWNGIIGMTD